MSVVNLARTEKSIKRIITRDDKSCDIYKEFAGDVEEDQEKVNCNQTEEHIDFRDRSLLLQVVEYWILRKLRRIELAKALTDMSR